MDLKELKETDVWTLFEHGRNYMRMQNIFRDTDRNYRMFNGNQWEGAKVEGIEQAQYNFIETIVNHKVGILNQNLWAIVFNSENFENKEFRATAEQVCEMLNKKAGHIWEKDQFDVKVREITEQACVNDEAVVYVDYDEENQNPRNEIIDKNNIQYGNEQNDDIQSQPSIIINQRKSILEVQAIARQEGVAEEKIKYIIGDNDTFEEPGEDAKIEKDDNCTLVTKMWKENGTVHFSQATRYVDIKDNEDTGLSLYPVAHYLWKKKKGSARGEGEVRYLIPNQLELNKSLARVLLTVKQTAYPQKIINISKIINHNMANKVGAVLKTDDGTVDDVSKLFGYVQPAQMSADVFKTMNDLISITRELKNTSDIATGGIDPSEASGKAILAVQQASQQPMVKQSIALKQFVEELARIWLDMWAVYAQDGMTLEEEQLDPQTGEKYTQLVNIPSTVIENLKATVKVDITPSSPFDKYAQELTLENLLKAGFLSPQMEPQLRIYAEALPDNASAPKQKILEMCDMVREEQMKIAQIDAQGKLMQQQAMQFINADPESQASQMNEARLQQLEAFAEEKMNEKENTEENEEDEEPQTTEEAE